MHTIRTALSRTLLAASSLAAIALVAPAASPVAAGGLRNCVDVPAEKANIVGCWESVWAGGVEYRMTFSNVRFAGTTPGDVDAFYVMAPQTAVAQGALPFAHDHVVRDIPRHNGGAYSTKLHGYFVLCSAQGIVSGACIATMSEITGIGTLPLARSWDGRDLTSVEPVEAGAAAGDLALLDTGAVIVGSISGH